MVQKLEKKMLAKNKEKENNESVIYLSRKLSERVKLEVEHRVRLMGWSIEGNVCGCTR